MIEIPFVGEWMRYARLAIALVILLVVAGFAWYVHALRADLAETRADLTTAHANVLSLTVQLQDLATQRSQLQTDLDAARARAATVRTATEKHTQQILAQPVAAQTCDDAAAWAVEQVKDILP